MEEKISNNRDEEKARYTVRRPKAYRKIKEENNRKIQRTG
jgi:hypothetical protein